MSEEEFGLFRDIWHEGTEMMCQDYVKPAYRLKEKIIATFKQNKKYKEVIDKAIEYINSEAICIDIRKTDGSMDYVSEEELLRILKGGSNE